MSMYSTCGFICHFRLCIFNKSTETEKVKVRYHYNIYLDFLYFAFNSKVSYNYNKIQLINYYNLF